MAITQNKMPKLWVSAFAISSFLDCFLVNMYEVPLFIERLYKPGSLSKRNKVINFKIFDNSLQSAKASLI